MRLRIGVSQKERQKGKVMEIEFVLPQDIEGRSFEIIGEELKARGIELPKAELPVTMRVIHTTADFEYADTLMFSKDAIIKAGDLLRQGANIVTDTNMALSGINKTALKKIGGEARCFMADEEIAEEAKRRELTRAYVSMERAAKTGGRTIFAIGNAPTALVSLHELYTKGIFKPDFVIGVPVGFVNVEAAKELIMESDMDFIVNRGRKGGSNVAAAIVNALMYMNGGR